MQILFMVMKMKKRVSICIFCVLLLCLLSAGIFVINCYYQQLVQDETDTRQIGQEELTQDETEELVPSMEVESVYEYVMVEENGYLVVYERDMETVFLETHIPLYRLSEELQDNVAAGKKFENVEAVYDFLENYSS